MGTPKFKYIVVCDLECTCWSTKEEQGTQVSEIIQIGACLLNSKSLEITKKTSYIIRPKFTRPSEFCTELTGFSWSDLQSGIPLGDACNKLRKEFGTLNKLWASWGNGDRIQFKNECESKNAFYPFGIRHLNISELYNLFIGCSKRISVESALKELGLKFEGIQHRAEEDAYNTARILKKLLENYRNV